MMNSLEQVQFICFHVMIFQLVFLESHTMHGYPSFCQLPHLEESYVRQTHV